jgi:hypothetical protein
VEDQSIKASEDESARGRALSFTMAMLQRRFASSVYALRRSLERMRDKRQKILADPEKYRKEQIEDRLPDDFDDLPEDEQMEIEARLEGVVASVDPIALREEIQRIGRLIDHARALDGREIESKLVKLRKVLSDNNVFNNPKMKLLIFTEHKDTLDYLERIVEIVLVAIQLERGRADLALREEFLDLAGLGIGERNQRLLSAAKIEGRVVPSHRLLEAFHAAIDVAVEKLEEEAKVLRVALVRVSCRGHQKIMVRHRRQRLTELVGECLFVSAIRRHLVRLVDDHEIPATAEQAFLGVLDARDPGD